MDHVISELCYKGTFYNWRIIIFYNFFVKFHGQKNGGQQHDHVLYKSLLNQVL